jgi:hypothetical protein
MYQEKTDLKDHVQMLKGACPMPDLMERIGLGDYAKKSCKSPFREDRNPSFGVFQSGSNWFFKDHATGESGDEIKLLALHHKMDPRCDFIRLVSIYSSHAGISVPTVHQFSSKPREVDVKRKEPPLSIGRPEQLKRMAKYRPYQMEALRWASSRGVLRFMRFAGDECYAITDQSRKLVEYRRVDNKPFNAYKDLPERKTHAMKGSNKGWPVGILESKPYPSIALVEGIPDFIMAHYFVLWEQASHCEKTDVRCAPVAMLGSSGGIDPEALPHFEGKKVRIFVHADKAGKKAAVRWREQIMPHAKEVNYLQFDGLKQVGGTPVSDLYDFLNLNFKLLDAGTRSEYWRIMP